MNPQYSYEFNKWWQFNGKLNHAYLSLLDKGLVTEDDLKRAAWVAYSMGREYRTARYIEEPHHRTDWGY